MIPQYEGKVVFVNAITDDPSAQRLSADFAFQYIPTSFFVEADGTIADSYTGPLTAEQMRERLDALVAE